MSSENNKKIGFFSDLHIGIHQNNEKWHDVSLEWANWFTRELRSREITKLFFGGDFFHYRDEINVKSLYFANTLLDLFNEFEIIMIPGNHDAYYKDNSNVHSLSILNNRANITILDKPTILTLFNKKVGFCPWGAPLKKVPECDLLIGHFEIQNFNFNSFKICEAGIESCDLLLKSQLILSGHFHKRQTRKYSNGEIIYAGNPFEMDFNDIQDQKGFYILDFNEPNIKYQFIKNNISPIHVKINLSSLEKLKKIAKEKGWSKLAIKIIIDKEIKTNLLDKIIASISFESPFSLTTDYLYKFNIGDNVTLTNELGDLNVKQCIIEYIDSLDIHNKERVIEKTVHLYNQFI